MEKLQEICLDIQDKLTKIQSNTNPVESRQYTRTILRSLDIAKIVACDLDHKYSLIVEARCSHIDVRYISTGDPCGPSYYKICNGCEKYM